MLPESYRMVVTNDQMTYGDVKEAVLKLEEIPREYWDAFLLIFTTKLSVAILRQDQLVGEGPPMDPGAAIELKVVVFPQSHEAIQAADTNVRAYLCRQMKKYLKTGVWHIGGGHCLRLALMFLIMDVRLENLDNILKLAQDNYINYAPEKVVSDWKPKLKKELHYMKPTLEEFHKLSLDEQTVSLINTIRASDLYGTFTLKAKLTIGKKVTDEPIRMAIGSIGMKIIRHHDHISFRYLDTPHMLPSKEAPFLYVTLRMEESPGLYAESKCVIKFPDPELITELVTYLREHPFPGDDAERALSRQV